MMQCFELAYQSYMSMGDVQRATRAAMRAVDAYRALGERERLRDAAAFLLRASEKVRFFALCHASYFQCNGPGSATF
jgi:hypothetical protein